MKCFICGQDVEIKESLNVVECNCKSCGKYAYERNFLTAYNYYFSTTPKNKSQVENFLKNYVPKHHICFVDDFETSLVEGYELKEFRDILNLAGFEIAHNNTIDSNWTD